MVKFIEIDPLEEEIVSKEQLKILIRRDAILESIEALIDGYDLSDFELSFPVVQKIQDVLNELRHNFGEN